MKKSCSFHLERLFCEEIFHLKEKQIVNEKANIPEERFRQQIRVILAALFMISCYLTGILDILMFYLPRGFGFTWEESQREDLLQRGFLHSKGGSPYGDAHFEQPWEFLDAAQIRPVEDCKGKILGQLDEEGRQCIDFNPYEGRINSHMIAIGRSGGGKTFTFVKTFMMQAMKEKHSLFIADPKGWCEPYHQCTGLFQYRHGKHIRTG